MSYVVQSPSMRTIPPSALPRLPRLAASIVTARDDSRRAGSQTSMKYARPAGLVPNRPRAGRTEKTRACRRAKAPGLSTPGRTRTCDPRLRRPLLYPTELRARAPRSLASFGRDTRSTSRSPFGRLVRTAAAKLVPTRARAGLARPGYRSAPDAPDGFRSAQPRPR